LFFFNIFLIFKDVLDFTIFMMFLFLFLISTNFFFYSLMVYILAVIELTKDIFILAKF